MQAEGDPSTFNMTLNVCDEDGNDASEINNYKPNGYK